MKIQLPTGTELGNKTDIKNCFFFFKESINYVPKLNYEMCWHEQILAHKMITDWRKISFTRRCRFTQSFDNFLSSFKTVLQGCWHMSASQNWNRINKSFGIMLITLLALILYQLINYSLFQHVSHQSSSILHPFLTISQNICSTTNIIRAGILNSGMVRGSAPRSDRLVFAGIIK